MELFKNLVFDIIVISLLLFGVHIDLIAQCDEVNQSQMSIMVVPYTSLNEDVLSKIENDANYRNVISVIDDAFIQKDFQTTSFIQSYKNLLTDNSISLGNSTLDEIVKAVISNSKSDIIIYAEVNIGTGNLGQFVEINLSAIDSRSSLNIASLPFNDAKSPQIRTSDYKKLAGKALNDNGGMERFLNDINNSFAQIREKGRVVKVKIEVHESSEVDLHEEMDDDYNELSDLIIEWVAGNAYKNNYRVKGLSKTVLEFDEIRIPLRDENCQNYLPITFTKEIRKAITKLLRENTNILPHRISASTVGNQIILIIEKK
jgi:hypothetical protein